MPDEFRQYIIDRSRTNERGCWLWSLTKDRDGYGYGCFQQRKRRAHILSYEAFVGPVPEGLHLDHLCRERSCVNPAHLEPVTCGENIRRGLTGRREQSHCKRGHAFAENGYLAKSGQKLCRLCVRLRRNAEYARNRDVINERARSKYHERVAR